MAEYYIALDQPVGMEGVISYARRQPDDPHVTLFKTRDVPEQFVNQMTGIMNGAIGTVALKPSSIKSFETRVVKMGYLLDLAGGQEQLVKMGLYLIRDIRVVPPKGKGEAWVFGDSEDRKLGKLHMGVFQIPNNFTVDTPEYVLSSKGLRKGLDDGIVITFGNVYVTTRRESGFKMKLSEVGVKAFREHLSTLSDDVLKSSMWEGWLDAGVNEFGDATSAGALMFDECLIRVGAFDNGAMIHTASTEGNNEYVEHLQRLAANRKS